MDIHTTNEFDKWINRLKDKSARLRIASRIDRLELGKFGDSKSLGGGLYELRIDYGNGYRVYFSRSGKLIIVLLVGGSKSSQQRDIATARKLMQAYSKGEEGYSDEKQ